MPNVFGLNICSVSSPKLHHVFQLCKITSLDYPCSTLDNSLTLMYKEFINLEENQDGISNCTAFSEVSQLKLTHFILIILGSNYLAIIARHVCRTLNQSDMSLLWAVNDTCKCKTLPEGETSILHCRPRHLHLHVGFFYC